MANLGTLDDPALARLWDAVSERLQRNGLAPRGAVTLDGLDRAERFALAGLVGHHVGDRARVDLAALDIRIRATGAAAGLVAAVTARRGPLVDRPGERAAASARRNAVWDAAHTELASCGLDHQPWVEAWLDSSRPIVARARPSRAGRLMATAVRCIARLPTAVVAAHGVAGQQTVAAAGTMAVLVGEPASGHGSEHPPEDPDPDGRSRPLPSPGCLGSGRNAAGPSWPSGWRGAAMPWTTARYWRRSFCGRSA